MLQDALGGGRTSRINLELHCAPERAGGRTRKKASDSCGGRPEKKPPGKGENSKELEMESRVNQGVNIKEEKIVQVAPRARRR